MPEDAPGNQPMNFVDEMVSRELRFSIGVETRTGRHYLSIPVANRMADYEEYYEIDRSAYERYRAEPRSAADFIRRCRNRELDQLLILNDPSPAGHTRVSGEGAFDSANSCCLPRPRQQGQSGRRHGSATFCHDRLNDGIAY